MNDADAAALGEYAAGFLWRPLLCLVKVSTGIGTGIVIDGHSYRCGRWAGDIGHVRVSPRSRHASAACRVAWRPLLAGARWPPVHRLGFPHRREVRELLAAGNADAADAASGRRIGRMATVVCLLNPEVVLIGGALASAASGGHPRDAVPPGPRATRHMAPTGALGEDAAIVGLTRFVVDHEFSSSAVNAAARLTLGSRPSAPHPTTKGVAARLADRR
jgi:predicted NBD/HSP70 family sugar kinase